MSRVRLLPIVIVAVAGLFVLKTAEFVTSGRSFFPEPEPARKATRVEDLPKFARALVSRRFVPPPEEPDVTGSVPPKQAGPAKTQDAKAAEPKETGPRMAQAAQPLPQAAGAERAVLERLHERRSAIDERQRELDLREALLKAAEKKVDGRLGELKAVEDRISAEARAEKEQADQRLKAIVIMYEAMKPKDAARVFDRLNLAVLVPIATTMNPRRMAEVLAAMSPEAAERLTVALASRAQEAAGAPAPASAAPAGELPRIDRPAQPPGRR